MRLLSVFLTGHIRRSASFAAERGGAGRGGAELGAALGFGSLLSISLRSLRSGNLLLSEGWPLALGLALAAAALGSLFVERKRPAQAELPEPGIGLPRTIGLCLGLFSVLILTYFAFTSPAAIARWGGVDYVAVFAAEAAALALFLGAWLGLPGFRRRLTRAALLAWNAVFILALALMLALRQPSFSAATIYPLYARDPGLAASVAFWVAIALHPVLFADFAVLAIALRSGRPSARKLSVGFGLGGLLLVLLALGQIFTTVYDYIPVIGPWFRDKFWLFILVPAVAACLSLLLTKPEAPAGYPTSPLRLGWLAAMIFAVAGTLIAGATSARPAPAKANASLRVMTYNIQQGYGNTGEKNFMTQRELLRRLAPDIVGLEESDSARAAGGNSDIVRFFSDGLGYYSYYGPSPISGTFGVALLSRYPIRDARTFFMPSRGEQTACIEADIAVGESLVRVLVTHLDNDGALPQQRLVIERAVAGSAGRAATIAMGDFNFDPKTEQYRQTAAALDDAWLAASVRIVDPGASDPAGRIDHVFVSRNARVLSARYTPEGPSDHPGMLVELGR